MCKMWPWKNNHHQRVYIRVTDNSDGRFTGTSSPSDDAYVTSMMDNAMYGMLPETTGRWVRANAALGSRVVGHAEIQLHAGTAALISTVALLPCARGHGICGEMMESLIAWLESNSHDRVQLNNTGGESSFRRYTRSFQKHGWTISYRMSDEAPKQYTGDSRIGDHDVFMSFSKPTSR